MMLALACEFAYRAVEMEHERVSKIDFNVIWDDAKAMGVANRDLLAVLAGMFLLLPWVIARQLLPEGAAIAPDTPLEIILQIQLQYYADNWHIMLMRELLMALGMLSMLVLLLRGERPTVGESLKLGLILLPSYMLAQLIEGFALAAGFMALVLPFFYLLARFVLVAPVAAAENIVNPIDMLRRSFALTRGNGWRIFVILAIIFATTQILIWVLMAVTGVIASLVLPAELADFVEHVAVGLVAAMVGVFTLLVSAAIYRTSAQPRPAIWQP
jgi:hypothetical protein